MPYSLAAFISPLQDHIHWRGKCEKRVELHSQEPRKYKQRRADHDYWSVKTKREKERPTQTWYLASLRTTRGEDQLQLGR